MILPYLSLPALLAAVLVILIAIALVLTVYWRHFHHFTYAVIFLLVSGLYFLIYQIFQNEVVSMIFYVTLISGLVVFLIDVKDFFLLFKEPEKKIKYCKHFQACHCGCGYGVCKHEKSKMINGNVLAHECSYFEMVENVHRKMNI
ncbi:MAG: hypothetical protein ACFFD4_13820 [Candidatus Odinarchaeota archaeon]